MIHDTWHIIHYHFSHTMLKDSTLLATLMKRKKAPTTGAKNKLTQLTLWGEIDAKSSKFRFRGRSNENST